MSKKHNLSNSSLILPHSGSSTPNKEVTNVTHLHGHFTRLQARRSFASNSETPLTPRKLYVNLSKSKKAREELNQSSYLEENRDNNCKKSNDNLEVYQRNYVDFRNRMDWSGSRECGPSFTAKYSKLISILTFSIVIFAGLFHFKEYYKLLLKYKEDFQEMQNILKAIKTQNNNKPNNGMLIVPPSVDPLPIPPSPSANKEKGQLTDPIPPQSGWNNENDPNTVGGTKENTKNKDVGGGQFNVILGPGSTGNENNGQSQTGESSNERGAPGPGPSFDTEDIECPPRSGKVDSSSRTDASVNATPTGQESHSQDSPDNGQNTRPDKGGSSVKDESAPESPPDKGDSSNKPGFGTEKPPDRGDSSIKPEFAPENSPDYALESSGGSIANIRNTQNYQDEEITFLGFTMCESVNGPRAMIQASVLPGECWSFRGAHGAVVIQLVGSVFISGVTLEHIPRSISPAGNILSAPREFSIWGVIEPYEDGTNLGYFAYDNYGPPVQYFGITQTARSYRYVEMKVYSNHGHPEYTCIYRLRVHGTLDNLHSTVVKV